MKRALLIFILFSTSRLFAIDRFVDPNLSAGNGTTLFTSITSAVAASVNGDRVLIVPGTYNEPTLTIGKSLTLLSQTAGSIINYNGNIVIAGFPGMKLEIIGFNLGVYSLSSNAITSGSANNRAKVSIVACRMTDLSVNQDYYELNCAQSRITQTTTYRYGSFVVSRTDLLYLNDEPNQNLSGIKHLIAADTIDTRLEVRNDDYPVTIANCQLLQLYFWKWNHIITNTNYIRNNQFVSGTIKLIFGLNPPAYNIDFSSNEFLGTPNYQIGGGSGGCGTPAGYYDAIESNGCGGTPFSTTVSSFPQATTSGFFKWTYNGIDLPCTVPTGTQPLVLTKITGPTGTNIDAGNPNHEYYDTDLTVNDRGRTGGPYSILNYNPSINPSNGKAFIFDLEMPADLFTGQQVDIKAKGYHKN
jgi:hypothetical protein